MCFGSAVVDDCGYCTKGNTGLTFNQNLDCSGFCNGALRADSCGVCQLPDSEDRITEHRDCQEVCFGQALLDRCGVCYNGTTGLPANSSLDACDVCNGDNSTCNGCDGVFQSGMTVDTCGQCGGNNCGCIHITSVSPASGPWDGGTNILIKGAGFFSNKSTSMYDSTQPNCGASLTNPDGTSIPVSCIFIGDGTSLQGIAYTVDQSTIVCTTTSFGSSQQNTLEFKLRVSIDGGPFTPPVLFQFFDTMEMQILRL